MTSDTTHECHYERDLPCTGDYCLRCNIFKEAVYPHVGLRGRTWLIEAKLRAGGFDEEGGNR